MTVSSFASCPMCRKVFAIDEQTPQIAIDGRLRFLCRSCRTPASDASKRNGPISQEDSRA